MDTSNWIQYHPKLKHRWGNQITAYKPNVIKLLPMDSYDEKQMIIKPQNNQSFKSGILQSLK